MKAGHFWCGYERHPNSITYITTYLSSQIPVLAKSSSLPNSVHLNMPPGQCIPEHCKGCWPNQCLPYTLFFVLLNEIIPFQQWQNLKSHDYIE